MSSLKFSRLFIFGGERLFFHNIFEIGIEFKKTEFEVETKGWEVLIVRQITRCECGRGMAICTFFAYFSDIGIRKSTFDHST